MNKNIQYDRLVNIVASFIDYGSKHLPYDVLQRLKEMRTKESSPMALEFYDAMFKNLEMSKELNRPICQDTGIIQFYVKVGTGFVLIDKLEEALKDAVLKASVNAPLRPNVVEVFDEKNTGNNIGTRIPIIDWEIVPNSDEITIYTYMAGGGCSLPGVSKVFMPIEGYGAIIDFVFDRICTYGINACPPVLVGVGIAGSADVAAKLSKKALLREIGSRNANPKAAELEIKMENGLNEIGIGPGGIKGNSSVMGVHIEQAGRHPATLAAGISTSCWVHRRSVIKIDSKLNYSILSHKETEDFKIYDN